MSRPKSREDGLTAPGGTDGRSASAFFGIWLPSLVVIIASGACLFALSWWITQTPGGGANLGLIIGLSSVFSLSTVVAFSGAIDRADRAKTITKLLLVLLLPIGALVAVLGSRTDLLFVVAAGLCYTVISTSESLYLAANETACVDLAPTTWASTRTALLTQMHSQVERVAAPMLTATLLTSGRVQLVPAAALVIVVAMLLTIRFRRRDLDAVTARAVDPSEAAAPPAGGALRALVRDGRAAVRLVRDRRDLVFLVQLGILGNLVVFPFYAVLPAYLTEYTDTPQSLALWYGRAATAYGVGMLVATLLLLRYRRSAEGRQPLLMATGSLGLICLLLLTATTTGHPLAVVAAMFLTGALFAVLVAVGGAVWLNRTPAALRVRVFSLRRLTVFSSIPIGTMLMGIGGSQFGYRSFLRLLLVFVLVALVVIWFRYLRPGADRTEPSAGAPATL
ncbi:MFS transporter [Micromonospora sp. DT233]|uniref:MFS transporter n=1 Tax=Micromonospora sp. DT233 TaxID=3393432 RepID=UPI003CFB56DD